MRIRSRVLVDTIWIRHTIDMVYKLPTHVQRQAEWPSILRLANAEVEKAKSQFPGTVKDAVQEVPVSFNRKPELELIADGVEPDLLGLFIGASLLEDENSHPVPSRIILYLENIRELVGNNRDRFIDEVRKTYLHEVGHYLGLNEEELAAQDLD